MSGKMRAHRERQVITRLRRLDVGLALLAPLLGSGTPALCSAGGKHFEGEQIMQGGRRNTGFKTTPMSGQAEHAHAQLATAAANGDQTAAGRSGVPRSGSREIADVAGSGLVEAGRQTTGRQQVQQVAPVLGNVNSV